MASGNEYLTSNSGIAYPFVEDAAGLVYGPTAVHGLVAMMPVDCMVDAMLVMPSTISAVYLTSIELVGSDYKFTFSDQDSNVIFTQTITWSPSAGRFTVLVLADTTIHATVKLLVQNPNFSDYLAGIAGTDLFGTGLMFETRTIYNIPKKVMTFELYDALPPIPEPDVPGPIAGDVKIISGYNISQETEVDDAGITSDTISAVAGAGAGLAPCQDPTPTVYKGLMQLIPDDSGNIQLVTGDDKCYAVIPHIVESMLELQGTCLACCSCQDYANVTVALHNLFDRSKVIYDRIVASRIVYNDGVNKFNTIIAPLYDKPVLTVNAMGGASWGPDPNLNVGASNFATFVIAVCNKSGFNIQLVDFDLGLVVPNDAVVTRVNWEHEGNGAEMPKNLTQSLSDYPLKRGRTYKITILAHSGPYDSDPNWAGQAKMTVRILPTVGSPYTTIITADYNIT